MSALHNANRKDPWHMPLQGPTSNAIREHSNEGPRHTYAIPVRQQCIERDQAQDMSSRMGSSDGKVNAGHLHHHLALHRRRA